LREIEAYRALIEVVAVVEVRHHGYLLFNSEAVLKAGRAQLALDVETARGAEAHTCHRE
jgi:hypothetical protein